MPPLTPPTSADMRRLPRRSGGFTLLEVLLGVAITAVIAVAMTSMLFATVHGTDSTRDMRNLLVLEKTLDTRVSAAIRSSSMVLAAGDNYLVLWMGDTNRTTGNVGLPNYSEIRRLEFDSVNQKIVSYTYPNPGADTAFALASNFSTMGQGGGFTATSWTPAHAVTAATWTCTPSSAQSAVLVSYRLTLSDGTQTQQLVGAAALRK